MGEVHTATHQFCVSPRFPERIRPAEGVWAHARYPRWLPQVGESLENCFCILFCSMVELSPSATYVHDGSFLAQGGLYVPAHWSRYWPRPYSSCGAVPAARSATHSDPTQPVDATPALDDFRIS